MEGKKVLITGASSGIGAALARSYAARGASLGLAARRMQRLQALKKELTDVHPDLKVGLYQTDVTRQEQCQRFIEAAAAELGGIDVLLNNAGISMRAALEDVELSVLQKVMDVNFWGTVFCTKAALPHLKRSRGSIVGVSSIAGFKGLPGRSGYSASKFAMHGFLESIRIELLPAGVHVLIACPGFTASEIRTKSLVADGSQQGKSPRNEQKMMTSQEVAEAILQATRHRKRTLVLTRQGKITTVANKFAPGWVDKQVLKLFEKEEGFENPQQASNPSVSDN